MIKKTIILAVLGAIGLMFFQASAIAQDVDKLKYPKLNEIRIPDVEKVTLDNGMRLYILEDRSLPVFNAVVRVNCGQYLDPEAKIGLGGICGTVMRTGGTQKWTGDELDELLEGIGGAVETNIGSVSGGAFVNVLSEYTDTGLEVLAEILRRPVFEEDKIDVAKMQIRSGIARRNDQIDAIGRREFGKLVYGAESAYARHEEYATINAISREDLINFHQAYVHPERIMMAVWGDFDKDEILQKIKQYFDDWQASGLPVDPIPRVNYNWRSKLYYIEKTDVEQAYIRMGHIGGMVTDPDYTDRIVMSSILGEGFGSRITDAVRTKHGLAYSTGGRYISHYSYPGYFFAAASTKPQSAIQATREMIKQIRSMQTDLPTKKEMEKGKDGYLNSFVFNFDSRREVLTRMMNYDFFGLPEDFLQKEKAGVENVTPEAVMAAAQNNLRPDEMVVLIVGNAELFEQPLDSLGLGPAETIDITIPTGEPEQAVDASQENVAKGMQMLAKAAEIAGGVENFKKINAFSIKGTITIKRGDQELPLGLEAVYALPDKRRNVLSMMGQFIYDVRDGNVGWKTGSTGDLEPMTDEDIAEADKEMLRNIIVVFQNLEDPPFQAVYDGPDVIQDIPIEWVALTDGEGNPLCRLGFGEDGRLICKSYHGLTAVGPGVIEEVYSEMTEVQGVQLPTLTTQYMNGNNFADLKVSEYLINPELTPDMFAKPE